MLACVERPGAPLEPHENGPGGPPFLVSAPPSPALPLSRLALHASPRHGHTPASGTPRHPQVAPLILIISHAPWRAGDEHMWAAGLRSGVQKSKRRGVGTRGVEGRHIGCVSSSIWRSTQHYGEFLQCSYSAFVMVGLPLGARERAERERKRKKKVCEELSLTMFVPTSRASRTASSALFVAFDACRQHARARPPSPSSLQQLRVGLTLLRDFQESTVESRAMARKRR